MKVAIFGTGQVYKSNKQWIPQDDIVFFIDNDEEKQGQYLDGKLINEPSSLLNNASYERIILMSAKVREMKVQLLNMGIPEKMIWYYQRYRSELFRGVLKIAHCGQNICNAHINKRILIVTRDLDYTGGTWAALRAAQVLCNGGYTVTLCAPIGDAKLIAEISDMDYSVILCPSLYYVNETELCWIKQFDIVLVNVFPMLQSACEISRLRPVMWWIHEAAPVYDIRYAYQEYDNLYAMRNINVVAVSDVAKMNFEKCYPNKVSGILPLAIPDEYANESQGNDSKEKVVFAIIGNISEIKGQIFFVQAAARFTEEERSNMEFWIVGKANKEALYYKELERICRLIPQVKFLGELTREEMRIKYREIDVVICASLEETLSIAIIEGMMHKKICVTTANTGIAEYIEDGVNGFICDAGDSKQLYEQMARIMKKYDKLDNMRAFARNTYEEYFGMDKFGEKLEKELLTTEALFYDKVI